ncbi:50S ribosomal protein L19 [Patescibacteria group bacterium]|nr:50S ribosomal protein L19 [Patescibacteria group bacterium]
MDIAFRVGDTIRVSQKIVEGEKTRLQVFEGIVLAINKTAKTFTVRKISDGVGVERIWSVDSPWIEKIEVKKKAGTMRRAKLYYLRNLTPKEVTRAVA